MTDRIVEACREVCLILAREALTRIADSIAEDTERGSVGRVAWLNAERKRLEEMIEILAGKP
jgi:hypothetical protein